MLRKLFSILRQPDIASLRAQKLAEHQRELLLAQEQASHYTQYARHLEMRVAALQAQQRGEPA